MATGVGRGTICLVSLNSPTPKAEIADFLMKFADFFNMATRVGVATISVTPFHWPTPKTHSLVQNSGNYLKCELSYCELMLDRLVTKYRPLTFSSMSVNWMCC